jgi:hypothetical protein
MTFQDLKNFPVFIKQNNSGGRIPLKGQHAGEIVKTEDTDYIKIHSNGTYEIINTFQEGPYRLMAYGIDTSKDTSLLNLALSNCNVIDLEQWQNVIAQLRQFLPED